MYLTLENEKPNCPMNCTQSFFFELLFLPLTIVVTVIRQSGTRVLILVSDYLPATFLATSDTAENA